jgi:site-specific DNA-cytosine methylase
LLVAGFACVDFSLLNGHKKSLFRWSESHDARPTREARRSSDLLYGESGGTFFAILDYADDFRPPLVILENVKSAPWDLLQGFWEDIGYRAGYTILDTKDYYISHTRQRGYMLCINCRVPDSGLAADGGGMHPETAQRAIGNWQALMQKFKRQASSSVEAFLLPPGGEQLQRAHEDMIRALGSSDRKDYAWDKCRVRYKNFRDEQRLGNGRPYSQWTENGWSLLPDYANTPLINRQTDRIKDTLDCALLLKAIDGVDIGYKS